MLLQGTRQGQYKGVLDCFATELQAGGPADLLQRLPAQLCPAWVLELRHVPDSRAGEACGVLFNTLTLQHDAEFVSSYPSFVLDSALSV